MCTRVSPRWACTLFGRTQHIRGGECFQTCEEQKIREGPRAWRRLSLSTRGFFPPSCVISRGAALARLEDGERDGDGLAPVPLSREDPVTQFVRDLRTAQSLCLPERSFCLQSRTLRHTLSLSLSLSLKFLRTTLCGVQLERGVSLSRRPHRPRSRSVSRERARERERETSFKRKGSCAPQGARLERLDDGGGASLCPTTGSIRVSVSRVSFSSLRFGNHLERVFERARTSAST